MPCERVKDDVKCHFQAIFPFTIDISPVCQLIFGIYQQVDHILLPVTALSEFSEITWCNYHLMLQTDVSISVITVEARHSERMTVNIWCKSYADSSVHCKVWI